MNIKNLCRSHVCASSSPSSPLSVSLSRTFLITKWSFTDLPNTHTHTHKYNDKFSVPYDRDQFQAALRCALFLSYPNKITVRCQCITWVRKGEGGGGEGERHEFAHSLDSIIDRASSLCARRAFNLIIDKFLVFLLCFGLLTFSQCEEKEEERERETKERRALITHSDRHAHVYVFKRHTHTHTPK